MIAALPLSAAACSDATGPNGPPPAGIVYVSGSGQQAVPVAELPHPVVVKVVDAEGRPVPRARVFFNAQGVASPAEAVTNRHGMASARWTIGFAPRLIQENGVRAMIAGARDPRTDSGVGQVTFVATACSNVCTAPPPPAPPQPERGKAVGLIVVAGDRQEAPWERELPDPLTVRAVDIDGRPVQGAAVEFETIGGSLSGGTPAPSGGVFRTAVLTGADGTASVRFTPGAPGAVQRPDLPVADLAVNATLRADVAGGATVAVMFRAIAFRPIEGSRVALDGRPFAVAVSPTDVVYVTRVDANSVARFDAGSTTPRLPHITVGTAPTDVLFNHDGSLAYVANSFGYPSVGVIDVAKGVQQATISVRSVGEMLLSPDDSRLYPGGWWPSVVETLTGTVVASRDEGGWNPAAALSRDGSKLYVARWAGGAVDELDASTLSVLRTFPAVRSVSHMVVSPDGTELWSTVFQSDPTFIGIVVTALATGEPVARIPLAPATTRMTLSPDGRELWIASYYSGEVHVVDLGARALVRTIFVGGKPRDIAFRSDGTAVVTNEEGFLTFVR